MNSRKLIEDIPGVKKQIEDAVKRGKAVLDRYEKWEELVRNNFKDVFNRRNHAKAYECR